MRRLLAVRSVFSIASVVVLTACTSEAGPIDPSLNAFDVRSVEVTPQTDTIFAADTIRLTDRRQLTATIKGVGDKPFEGARAVWYSEDSTIAVVNESGVVRPLKYGTVRIVASASKKGYATIVVAPAVASVTVTPSLDTVLVRDPVLVGDTLRIRATTRDVAGAVVAGSRTTWTSINPAIATVDTAGLVRVLSPGTAQIRATSSGVSATATIVVAPQYKSILVTAPVTRALAFDTIQLVGTATNYANTSVAGATFTWSTSNAAIATVSNTGEVRAIAPGTVTITASANFRSSGVTLSISERQLLKVSAGGDFSCGTAPLGRLYCWGSNARGQLATPADSVCFGVGFSGPCTLEPKRQSGPAVEFATISTGGQFACGLTVLQQIYCWGEGTSGQLGNGTRGPSAQPVLATVLNERFSSISVGQRHACALTPQGKAFCWGDDSNGQLGDRRRLNSTTPIPVWGDLTFTAISAGGEHTCGIVRDQGAFCWGSNDRGQLGTGMVDAVQEQPVSVQNGQDFATISAGYLHTCATTVGGRAFCWGDNSRGQLGIGSPSGLAAPSPLPVAGNLAVSTISTSSSSASGENQSGTCALSVGGEVYCWGDNFWRQAGSETADLVAAPNLIMSGTSGGFRSISTGSHHSCALGVDGNTWCWGSNVLGALGNGLQAAGRHLPQQVKRPR